MVIKTNPRIPKSKDIKESNRYENVIMTAMATNLPIRTMNVVAHLTKHLMKSHPVLYESITTDIIQ